jgi:hypothetical protein
MFEEQNGAPAADALNVGASEVESADALNTEEVVENQGAAQEAAKAEARRIRELKLKVHGEEITEELPFEIEENPEAVEYLTKQLQLSKAAQRAMQENSSFQKQVQQFFSELKTNTKAKLVELGIDPKEFAASVIEEEIKRAEMSPEQIRQQELEEELNKLKAEAKKKEEEFNQRELERLREIEFEKIDTQMTSAIDKSDLPKKPYVVRKMAEYMLIGARNGINLSADEVLPLVREELLGDLQEIINSLPEEKAEEFIGKEVLNRFRKKNLAKAKQTPASVKSSIKDVGTKKTEEKPAAPINYKNFFGF